MKRISALIAISRPANCLLAAGAVALGFWLGKSTIPIPSLLLLVLVAAAATAFGNVVNDLCDIETDRISHPGRPLITNELSVFGAVLFAIVLIGVAVIPAFLVSPMHGIAVIAPIAVLTAYAFLFKRTPFIGNIVVGSLVAYPIIFGALGSPQIQRLYVPALLAFLLNVGREIIKDLQDAPGDRKAHMHTTAAIPAPILRLAIAATTMVYLGCLFLPAGLHQFGATYVVVCFFTVIPLHATRLLLIFTPSWLSRLSGISTLYKLEMLAGLIALAADEVFRTLIR
jgi:geranylgeranylglycerol-phosphate geranylgeranyltransferase